MEQVIRDLLRFSEAFEQQDVTALAPVRREEGIIAVTPVMQGLLALLQQAAQSPLAIVLTGETGTGKTLLAQAVHRWSQRRQRPFIALNCGALPETLCESEMFGYRRGAFSGATQDRRGLFEAADGGTLFLDEVGELSPALQAKLLHALQDGSFRRIGDLHTRRADVRVIAATNRHLETEVAQGRFRPDLYYRLCVLPLEVPPLRDRRADIPALVDYLFNKHQPLLNPKVLGFSDEALEYLFHYDYPGNIRELENLVQRGLALAPGPWIAPGLWQPRAQGVAGAPTVKRLERPARAARAAERGLACVA
ncbi:MAG: sigma-54 interaction domain-containing protein [Gammaproteobacteria bacterium]